MKLRTAEEAAAATLAFQKEQARVREEAEYNEWLARVTIGIEEAIENGLGFCEFNSFGFPDSLFDLMSNPPYKYKIEIFPNHDTPGFLRISWSKDGSR